MCRGCSGWPFLATPASSNRENVMAYDNNMSGALFRNERKETEKQPDYTGECEVRGEKLRISAWLRESKNGKKYMSLAFSEPYQGENKVETAAAVDGEVPF